MSKEKRIEIIADICPFYKEYGTCEQCNTDLDVDGEPCYWECMANAIINNGYRKQEWISVDERLPEDDTTVLAYGGVIYYLIFDVSPNGVRWWTEDYGWFTTDELGITHWMPLPEAPKGGNEK